MLACPSYSDGLYENQGIIYVGTRDTYDTVYQIGGYTTNSFFGSKLQVIESDDGLQLQLFSIKYNPTYALSYIDIIYNPNLSTDY